MYSMCWNRCEHEGFSPLFDLHKVRRPDGWEEEGAPVESRLCGSSTGWRVSWWTLFSSSAPVTASDFGSFNLAQG